MSDRIEVIDPFGFMKSPSDEAVTLAAFFGHSVDNCWKNAVMKQCTWNKHYGVPEPTYVDMHRLKHAYMQSLMCQASDMRLDVQAMKDAEAAEKAERQRIWDEGRDERIAKEKLKLAVREAKTKANQNAAAKAQAARERVIALVNASRRAYREREKLLDKLPESTKSILRNSCRLDGTPATQREIRVARRDLAMVMEKQTRVYRTSGCNETEEGLRRLVFGEPIAPWQNVVRERCIHLSRDAYGCQQDVDIAAAHYGMSDVTCLPSVNFYKGNKQHEA